MPASSRISQFFGSAFPPPRYILEHGAGVDISDRSIKFAELSLGDGGILLTKHGEEKIPSGVVERIIENPTVLTRTLSALAKKYRLKRIVGALPEEQTYIVKVRLPPMPTEEMRRGVQVQLEELVPVPVNELTFDYEIVSRPSPSQLHYDLLVTALPTHTADEYAAVIEAAGMMPIAFETEGHALARALLSPSHKETVMLVDFGKLRTGIYIVSGGLLAFSVSVPFGGAHVNGMIMQKFEVDELAAENMKRGKGLAARSRQEFNELMQSSISVLADELNSHIFYWHDHKDETGEPRQPVREILLVGGSAYLSGLTERIESIVRVPTRMGNPWINILRRGQVSDLHADDALRYATAIGLALRGLPMTSTDGA